MTALAAVDALLHKEYGDEVGGLNPSYTDHGRVPTGYFPFDLATGGGFPRRGCSIVFGAEGCGKTTLLLRAVAEHQRRWPKWKVVWIDQEHVYEPKWATAQGVDVTRLYVYQPEYAEQAVDIAEAVASADDVGLLVLDSVAALTLTQQIKDSSEKDHVAIHARIGQKLSYKLGHALGVARKQDRPLTVVLINQLRSKITSMGSPESMPGGNALKFLSSLTVRMWGTDVFDAKKHPVMPYQKRQQIVLRKWRVPVLARSAEWHIALFPRQGLTVGQSDDWPVADKFMRYFNLLGKEGKGWQMIGKPYKTLDAARLAFMTSDQGEAVRTAVSERLWKLSSEDEGEVFATLAPKYQK